MPEQGNPARPDHQPPVQRKAGGRWRLPAAAAAVLVVAAAGAVAMAQEGGGETGGGGETRGPVAVTAFPLPGTAVASARTQITLRGAPADQLGTIEVVGSRSGPHAGELRAHPDGRGASFVPREPFRAGEAVSVRTQLQVRGARDGNFRLRIARDRGLFAPGAPPPPGGPAPVRGEATAYRSRPDLRPPAVTIARPAEGVAPGRVLLGPKFVAGAPRKRGDQSGPMIVDDRGEPFFFTPVRGFGAADVRIQEYRGQPVLTWWQGRAIAGQGEGEAVVLDASYREVARVRGGNGYPLDLHEFLLTPQGTALVIAYRPVRRDLRAHGGPRDGLVVDNIVQELDLQTGLVLFEWHSLGPVGLDESYVPVPRDRRVPWDYIHVNSVDVEADGDLLVSARHTWTVYEIDRETGQVNRRLGGKRSDFEMGPGTRFFWQHDARQQPDGTLRIFDNAARPKMRERSRIIVVALEGKRARLVRAFTHPDGLLSTTQANAQALPGGNLFVGWGAEGDFSEFGADGRLRFDGRLEAGFDSYRAYRQAWTGRPRTAPAVAAARTGGGDRVTVHASWNGATEVSRWEVLAGARPEAVTRPVGAAARAGFETRIRVRASEPYVVARALDADGRVLGTSRPVEVRQGRGG